MSIPDTLNHYPVIASAPCAVDPSLTVAVVYRRNLFHAYAVVLWEKSYGSAWIRGDYHSELSEAARNYDHQRGVTIAA